MSSSPRSPKRSPRLPRRNYENSSLPNLTIDNKPPPGVGLESGPGQISKAKTQFAQKQVEEVTNILKDNVRNLVEREGKLKELESRAETIAESSKIFEKTTHKVKETYWRQHMKKFVITGVIATVIVIILAGILYETVRW